jgi:hypothetical protein
MVKLPLPEPIINDLISFISKTYPKDLPNSLLIAQAFILKYQNYGNEFSLSEINNAIEDIIKNNLL